MAHLRDSAQTPVAATQYGGQLFGAGDEDATNIAHIVRDGALYRSAT